MEIKERLHCLRQLMQEEGMAAYLVPTDDFHASEYVGDHFKSRAFLSGFTGSAGTLVVLEDKAALWVDGRYFLQGEQQLAGSPIDLMKMGEPGVPTIPQYLARELKEGQVLGFDGRTIGGALARTLAAALSGKKITFAGDKDLVDQVWTDRPPLSTQPVWELSPEYTGQTREEKLTDLRRAMEQEGASHLVLSALDQIAWVTNLRGNDVACTPVFLSYLLVGMDKATLCVHREILSDELADKLAAAGVELADYDQIYSLLAALPQGSRVMAQSSTTNCRILSSIPQGVELLDRTSPVLLAKALKNPVEMDHIARAHVLDGVAVCRFIHWLQSRVGKENITELSAAAKLEDFRRQMEGYVEPSFDTIMAYGPHGAIVHYGATKESSISMEPRGLCLCDSGGHYLDGTTDITRTIPLGPLTEEERTAYTLVLRGHLRLGAAKFKEGACGANLDYLARSPLWERGMDYNHGTGHGVGYLLCVHEGPQNFHWNLNGAANAQPLMEGMVISNEPGFYQAGQFGIRHEDLMLVRKGEANQFGRFMYFQTLTMVPFDTTGLDLSLMTQEEVDLLNGYHKQVFATIAPYLEEEELAWLERATQPIAK